ncbi:MAG: hypothetical protein AB1765_03935 [Candidatus Hydrogenedentota bacterium]
MKFICPFCSTPLTTKTTIRTGICPSCKKKIKNPSAIPVYQKIANRIIDSVKQEIVVEFDKSGAHLQSIIETRLQVAINNIATQFQKEETSLKTTQSKFITSVQTELDKFIHNANIWFEKLQNSYKAEFENGLKNILTLFNDYKKEALLDHDKFKSQINNDFKNFTSKTISDFEANRLNFEAAFNSLQERITRNQTENLKELTTRINQAVTDSIVRINEYLTNIKVSLEKEFLNRVTGFETRLNKILEDKFLNFQQNTDNYYKQKELDIDKFTNEIKESIENFKLKTKNELFNEFSKKLDAEIVNTEKKIKETLAGFEELVNKILLGKE